MSKLKNLFTSIANNLTEIWLGLLLFIGLPYALALYTDWRAFLVLSFSLQSAILLALTYKATR